MNKTSAGRFACAILTTGLLHGLSAPALADSKAPVVLVSSSGAFDRSCTNYYQQGNDTDVAKDIAPQFCDCISGNIEAQGLGSEVLDFLGRTYSEDLTAFISEYPNGEAWMQVFFAADQQCKTNVDFGSNEPPPSGGNGEAASSWGGTVRAGPGKSYKAIGSLENGDRVTLLENAGQMDNGYPWWKIAFGRSREGYQWGGILCTLDQPIEGVYETCD